MRVYLHDDCDVVLAQNLGGVFASSPSFSFVSCAVAIKRNKSATDAIVSDLSNSRPTLLRTERLQEFENRFLAKLV